MALRRRARAVPGTDQAAARVRQPGVLADVRLELTSLHEVGRLPEPAAVILRELTAAVGLREDPSPFSRVVDIAERLAFTRDPFDRMILVQAIAADAPLVTKDARLLAAHETHAVWS